MKSDQQQTIANFWLVSEHPVWYFQYAFSSVGIGSQLGIPLGIFLQTEDYAIVCII